MAYYAVRKGRKTGIFESWAECREQIFRFSGAVYKSFMTLEEAKAYLEKGSVKKTVTGKVAYVDGSYDETLGYSYGQQKKQSLRGRRKRRRASGTSGTQRSHLMRRRQRKHEEKPKRKRQRAKRSIWH